jgi:hypothetical protein
MLKRTVFAIAVLCPIPGHAAEQIPCWKAVALKAWAGGDTAKAERIAMKHGYTRAQIAEVRQRCVI